MSFARPHRITAFLLMLFLCFAAWAPLRAAASAAKPPATVKTGRAADDVDDISIDDLLRELDDKADKTGSWLTRERGALLRAAAGVGVSVAAAALLLWLAHCFSSRATSCGNCRNATFSSTLRCSSTNRWWCLADCCRGQAPG